MIRIQLPRVARSACTAQMLMLYQALRSVSDNHVIVICQDGEFDKLPDHVRHQGPWQATRRGRIEDLKPEYWLDLEDYGYVLVRSELASFRPDMG